MRYSFKCPLPPTLNDQVNEARTNRYKSAATKKKWTRLVADIVADAPKFEGDVWVIYEWFIKNFRRDGDNVKASAKYLMDGLEIAGIIKNDNLSVIQSPQIDYFYKATEDHVIVTLSDEPIFCIVFR